MSRKKQPLCQYNTPAWAARDLWRENFSNVEAGSIVLEPTCGDGRMVQAVPPDIQCIGIEIDPGQAEKARVRNPGREIIVGDVLTMPLPDVVDVVFGNPPFQTKFMDQFLERLAERYADGLKCGLILPAYFMQTPSRVNRWNRIWTVSTELLPRTLFPSLRLPLVWGMFTKDPVPSLNGMRLYIQADAINRLPLAYRKLMVEGRGLWAQVVEHALKELGGKAHLNAIYLKVGGRRPTPNPWWREKVRQTLQRGDEFISHGSGMWEWNEAA